MANRLSAIKTWIRELEASFTPCRRRLDVSGRTLSLTRSLWWDESSVEFFEREIEPYWQVLRRRDFQHVWDLGAASGLFSLSACIRFPAARSVAFEPSLRQRTLLLRNIKRNGFLARVEAHGFATWSRDAELTFRTHGAISALEASGDHLRGLPFGETVKAVALDSWNSARGNQPVDLIKMDIEGAEIETIEGARSTIARFHPVMLVQAYHMRDGRRTLEPCAQMLAGLGYDCHEVVDGQGFLYGEYHH